MAGITATGPLERLARDRVALVAWLASRFGARLNHQDCEDIVADALPRLADDPQLPGDPARADAYVRRALWRDALDELRRRYGRDLERPAPLPLERMWERPQSEDGADEELAARQHREHVQAATARMLDRLSASEAKLLRLRFLDEAPPQAIADELGVSRAQYYRRLSEASQHALDALVETYSGPACPHVRRLIRTRPEGLLGREDAGRRDAHLEECVHCRAFSLRARGALELLPLPAVGLLDRVGLRLGGLFGRGGDSIAAVRDGSELAAGGGVVAGAGTALTAGLGAKVAVGCTGAAVAVLCAGPLGVVPNDERTPTKQAAEVKRERAKPARRATATPVATSVPTVTAVPTSTATQTPSRQTTPRPKATKRSNAAREFGPESSAPPEPRKSVAIASREGGEFSPPPPPPPMPKPTAQSSAPSSSSFAGEFAP